MTTSNINGVELYYVIHGSKSPILFIHGFPLSGKLWEPLVEPLRDKYKLIIPDLRGMGRSAATSSVSWAQYIDDLAAMLDHIGESRPVVVVALSMGGYLAFEFFRRHRERVRALVLADTRAEPDTPEKAKNREQTADKVLESGSKIVVDDMQKVLWGKNASQTLRSEWHAIMSATAPQGVAAALLAMSQRPDSRPTLPKVNVPTLLIVGEEDTITPVDAHQAMHEAIAGSRLEIIPGAGHMTPVETPQAFTKVLTFFLESLDNG